MLATIGGCATRPPSADPPPSPAPASTSEEVAGVPVDREELEAYAERLAAAGFAGAVLVTRDGETLLRRGYGMADEAAGAPVTDSTLFYLASVSKQFTAAAVVQLVDRGLLSVDDTLGAFFPRAPADRAGITVHQLLTHTSGLAEYVGGVDERVGRGEALRRVLAEPLRFAPGAEYGYSNGGYALLAMIVADVSGVPFAEHVRRELFEPAGMTQTIMLGETPPPGVHAAHGYTDGEDEGDFAAWTGEVWAHLGAGGVFSTLRDMARWEEALRGDRVVSAAAKALLFAPHVPTRSQHYGYGWRIADSSYGGRVVFHYGSEDNGMNAAYMRFVERGAAVIVLSNRTVDGTPLAASTAVALAHELLEPGYDELPEYAQ